MSRSHFVAAVIVSGMLLASCNDHDSPTQSRASNSWTVTSTLTTAEGTDACVTAPPAGPVTFPQTIIINGSAVLLPCNDECPVFTGTLTGDDFTASADGSYDSSVCGHVHATLVLTGTFSADRRNLTATEVVTSSEPSGHQVVIRYSWTGTRN